MCASHKMEDLFNIHNLVTLIQYYKEYKGLPYAFRNAANPGKMFTSISSSRGSINNDKA